MPNIRHSVTFRFPLTVCELNKVAAFLLAVAVLALGGAAHAGNTWDGGGGNNDWGTGANWNPDGAPAPGSGNDLTFAGNTRLTPHNNYTAFDDWRNIFFASGAGSFTIGGNAIDLFGKVENLGSNTQTFNLTIGTGSSSGSFIEINPVEGNLNVGGSDIFLGNNQLRVFGNNAKTVTFGSGTNISGTGGTFVVRENSTAIFQSAHTYTGSTFVNAGKLQFNSGGSANSSTVRLGNESGTAAAEIVLNSAAPNSTLVIRSGSSGTKTVSAINTSGTSTWAGNVFLDADLTTSAASGGTLAFTGAIFDLKNQTLNVGGAGNTTISGELQDSTGSGKVTKTGSGTLTLSGTNTYTGTTTVLAGTLLVGANAPSGSAGALGNASGAVLLGNTSGTDGASLLTDGAFTVGRAITVQSGNTGNIVIGGNTATASTFSGNITLGTASGTAKNVILVAATGGSVEFSGVINENTSVPASNVTIGTGPFSGTVRLSNTGNGYSGVTTITNGRILEVTELDSGGSNSSIGNSSGDASNLVLSGGTLRYIGGGLSSTNRLFDFNANGATLDAAADVSFTGTGSLVASGTFGNRTLTLTGASNGSLASIIPNPINSFTTSVTKSGSGTWTLSGNNTYGGGTTIIAGTLSVSSDSNLGTSDLTINGGVLRTTASASFSRRMVLDVGDGIVDTAGFNPVWNGAIDGPGDLIKDGAGALTLTNIGNSYTGRTIVLDGALVVGSESQTGTSEITLNGGTLRTSSSATFTRRMILDANDGTVDTNGFSPQIDGIIEGPGRLTKSGNGTLKLTGANTYSGGTIVSGGTLQANNTTGSATGSGTVTVDNGGTLAGSGAVTGAVTIKNGGTLAPGTSIQSLDTGTLSFESGSTFSVEINSDAALNVAADLVNATGDLTIADELANLSFISSGSTVLAGGTKFTLISYTGTWNNGIFFGLEDDSLVTVGVNTYVINYNDTLRGSNFGGGPSGESYLTLTAVPEASAFLFGGIVCLVVGLTYGIRAVRRRGAIAAACST